MAFLDVRGIRKTFRRDGKTVVAIENFDPAHWGDILLDGPKRAKQIENVRTIIRNMGKAGIAAKEVTVVGDPGDESVPADLRILSGHQLRTVEAALTGDPNITLARIRRAVVPEIPPASGMLIWRASWTHSSRSLSEEDE